ncbi:hypothetical protein GQ44DRAFT_756020 [Phaeosphaeriaceae sp. PMI808]|nr:hypothetical protein GQ44DRAFT_756020 [Phaeosphaeriaceae sp. PMI808]
MAASSESIQAKRLLRMTVAHYKQPNISEEEFHEWVVQRHAIPAAKLHVKNGIEAFNIIFAPKSFRDMTAKLNALRETHGQRPWIIRQHDAQVEFFFRDMETFFKGATDPDFQALQAEEEPFISGIHAEVSIGWVEAYVHDGKVVNISDANESTYPMFKEASTAPAFPM